MIVLTVFCLAIAGTAWATKTMINMDESTALSAVTGTNGPILNTTAPSKDVMDQKAAIEIKDTRQTIPLASVNSSAKFADLPGFLINKSGEPEYLVAACEAYDLLAGSASNMKTL